MSSLHSILGSSFICTSLPVLTFANLYIWRPDHCFVFASEEYDEISINFLVQIQEVYGCF